jgi:hypothetical protein
VLATAVLLFGLFKEPASTGTQDRTPITKTTEPVNAGEQLLLIEFTYAGANEPGFFENHVLIRALAPQNLHRE